MAAKSYDKIGRLHKLGYINKAWRERLFALDTARGTLLYFRTEDALDSHLKTGAQTQAGTIQLKTAIMYVADYMDYPFCIELATRDEQAITTRHYFLFGATAAEMRDWMLALVSAGATAAGPTAPMRVVPEGKRPSALLGAEAASYNSMQDDPAALEPLPFPVRLAKFGFLQKRGKLNSSYKTRFCRVEQNAQGLPVLVYYSSVETTPRQGEVQLQGVKIEDDAASADALGFKLTQAGSDARSFFMRAPSKAQKRKWCNILARVAAGEKWAPEEPAQQQQQQQAVAAAQPSAVSGASSQVASPSVRSSIVAPVPVAAAAPAAAAAASPTPPASADGTSNVRVVTKDGKQYKQRKIKLKPRSGGYDSDEEQKQQADDSVVHSRDVSVTVAPVVAPVRTITPAPAGGANNMNGPLSPPYFADTPAPSASPESGARARDHSPSSRRKENERAAAALNAAAAAAAPVPSSVAAAAAEPSVSRQGAANHSESRAGGDSGEVSAAQLAESLGVVAAGSEMFKVPTGSFASVDKKRFFLLPVGGANAKANELLASARKEMKGKEKKVAYYDSIRSGFLLHWDSSKAHAYESFVWLDPRAPRTDWLVHWGQTHGLFARKKLKAEFSDPAVARRSFTIVTKERSIDLIVDRMEHFAHWRNVLRSIDAQRP